MGSDIFKNLIERKIDIFASTFGDDSNTIFKKDEKLFHPLEYGMYKEKCFKELLEFIVEKDTAISDGFIISSKNSVSTQCDLIIYQSNVIPLIDNNIAKFFPVEIVKAIGEIKSTLSKAEFIDALQKLARNKKLMEERNGKITYNGSFDENQYITSFLICNKLDFKFSSIDFEEVYRDIPRKFWHNFILSLEDGLFAYKLDIAKLPEIIQARFIASVGKVIFPTVFWENSLHIEDDIEYPCSINFIQIDQNNKYNHILHFLTALKSNLNEQIQFEFDFIVYLDFNLP